MTQNSIRGWLWCFTELKHVEGWNSPIVASLVAAAVTTVTSRGDTYLLRACHVLPGPSVGPNWSPRLAFPLVTESQTQLGMRPREEGSLTGCTWLAGPRASTTPRPHPQAPATFPSTHLRLPISTVARDTAMETPWICFF